MLNMIKRRLNAETIWYNYIKPMEILTRCANKFFVEIGFWIENLEVEYYEDHVNKSKI